MISYTVSKYISSVIIINLEYSFLTKILLIISLSTIVVVYAIGGNQYRIQLVQPFVLICAYSLLAVTLIIASKFNPNSLSYSGVIYSSKFYLFNSPLIFGFDGIALAFVILVTLLTPYCIISSWDLDNSNRCTLYIFLIEFFLIMTSLAIDSF